MFRKPLIAVTLLAIGAYAFADSNFILQDELAMKASAPVTQRTVINPASTVSYSGTSAGAPTWARPFADGTCCSGIGPVRYSVQQFYLSANDACDIASTQTMFDGFLFVYQDPFNPLTQTVNYLAGNDDGNGGPGTSNIDGVALLGNTTYTVVTTGFQAGDEGPFANTITCPLANVTLGALAPAVPAPTMSTTNLALLAVLVALVGLVVVRTRNS